MATIDDLVALALFPPAGEPVDLAVSGGPDSVGMLLLAQRAGCDVRVHHVNHHARSASDEDAAFVVSLCEKQQVPCTVYDALVEPGANFEARARAARRQLLPEGVLTGHTMDDLAETVIINFLRGAGIDGLSVFVGNPTKPLIDIRRSDLHEMVRDQGITARIDETNADTRFQRNRIRHELLPEMNDVASRDIVPLLARQAAVLADERVWIEGVAVSGFDQGLSALDCRVARSWPRPVLRRWLRRELRTDDGAGGYYAPSFDEVERAIGVVQGDVVATELSGGRRLSRKDQTLFLG
jgi:tRNA(Ile)-lysidine synthase